MSVTCLDIIHIMEQLAPKKLAESWDNVGLILGDEKKKIHKILVALDPSMEVIEEAVELEADMLLTHHPILFNGAKSIGPSTPEGAQILKMIQHNMVLYSAHTNLDCAKGGLNDYLAHKCKLKSTKLLNKTTTRSLYKLVVFVPIGHSEEVREAMCNSDAGHIDQYSDCTFSSKGTGTFKPLKGSNPYIGQIDKLEHVDEVRIETVVFESKLSETIRSMKEVHPYEEVAYDIYKVEQEGLAYGYGRIGKLENTLSLKAYAHLLKQELNLPSVRVVGDLEASISNVAVCTGSGMEFRYDAVRSGADVYVTGDMKYHNALDMKALGLNLIDVGHYGSEIIVTSMLKAYLENHFGNEIVIHESKKNIDPFIVI